jgi:hypothetical protein
VRALVWVCPPPLRFFPPDVLWVLRPLPGGGGADEEDDFGEADLGAVGLGDEDPELVSLPPLELLLLGGGATIVELPEDDGLWDVGFLPPLDGFLPPMEGLAAGATKAPLRAFSSSSLLVPGGAGLAALLGFLPGPAFGFFPFLGFFAFGASAAGPELGVPRDTAGPAIASPASSTGDANKHKAATTESRVQAKRNLTTYGALRPTQRRGNGRPHRAARGDNGRAGPVLRARCTRRHFHTRPLQGNCKSVRSYR